MSVIDEGKFFGYTMPIEAQEFTLGAHFDSRGNLGGARNVATVDWTTRKWYRLGWRYDENFTDTDATNEWGFWVGDLDDLEDFDWLPLGVASIDPLNDGRGFDTFMGLMIFEGTDYLSMAVSYDNETSDWLLIKASTGVILDSATSSNSTNPTNVEAPCFPLPTGTSTVFHRYDNSDVATDSNTRWAVIKFDLSAETVDILVDYELMPAGIQGIDKRMVAKGREGSGFNTVFHITDAQGVGKLWEVTIPHSTTSASDLSWELIVTVDGVADASSTNDRLVGVYYEATTDRIIYGYRPFNAGGSPWHIIYEAVTREAPTTILWSTQIESGTSNFSEMSKSSYIHHEVLDCTCVDELNNMVINTANGTVTEIEGLSVNVFNMGESKVWSTFKNTENWANSNAIPNTFTWPASSDPEDEVAFVQAYMQPFDLVYTSSPCVLTGISFGEEKDPLYIDFGSIE